MVVVTIRGGFGIGFERKGGSSSSINTTSFRGSISIVGIDCCLGRVGSSNRGLGNLVAVGGGLFTMGGKKSLIDEEEEDDSFSDADDDDELDDADALERGSRRRVRGGGGKKDNGFAAVFALRISDIVEIVTEFFHLMDWTFEFLKHCETTKDKTLLS